MWGYYADAGQILGDAGHALFDIFVTGNDRKKMAETIDRLQSAYFLHPVETARSRALTMTRIACLQVRSESLSEALKSVRVGLADADGVHSARLRDDLRVLDSILAEADPGPNLADELSAVRAHLATTVSAQLQ
ncbi:hypothetical protein D0Q02_29135 [Micromonospora craniellae]|uniref:Uncharacterized protein n=1 Tax=Micromonospora craniellae TaxID=2294034 RepID=A0A372FR76_9ACTN|nr:hypothetical protein D0Q02_29135 [Micromonospora craniellae]